MIKGVFTIFQKLEDVSNYYDRTPEPGLSIEQKENLIELSKRFKDINIVVTNSAINTPFTIAGVSEILKENILAIFGGTSVPKNQVGEVLKIASTSIFNQTLVTLKACLSFFQKGVTITKTGDSFKVTSDLTGPITVYIPPWMLVDGEVNIRGHQTNISMNDNIRIGLILHEIGHWTSGSMALQSIAVLTPILGFFLFIFSMFKIIVPKKNSNSTNISALPDNSSNFFQKTKAFTSAKFSNGSNWFKTNILYIILGLTGFIMFKMLYVSHFLRTLAESNSDNIAKEFGYGKELGMFLKEVYNAARVPVDDMVTDFTNIETLFREFFIRIKQLYPSPEWRLGNLFESEESFELFVENDYELFSKLQNIMMIMSIKFDKLANNLPSLIPLNKISIISRPHNINENIQLLINECN